MIIYFRKLISFLLVNSCGGMFVILATIAPSGVLAAESYYKPKMYYSATLVSGRFASAGEAFAAYAAFEEAANATRGTDPYGQIHVVGYEPWANCGMVNGEPACYQFRRVDKTCPSGCLFHVLSAVPECGDDFSPVTVYSGADREVKCMLRQEEPQRNCLAPKAGNPIYPSTGLKEETALDYSSDSSGLKFERIYRSDSKRWSHNHQIAASDFSVSSGMTRPCQPGIGRDTRWPACYELIGSSSTDQSFKVSRGPDRILSFSGGTSLSPDVQDEVTTTATGWRVRNAEARKYESFAQSGVLVSSVSATGVRLNYTYSDGTTPPSVAPKPDLLIRVEDQFGRGLAFRYDDQSRLIELIDPANSPVSYAYGEGGAQPSLLTSVTYPGALRRQYLYNELEYTNNSSMPFALTGVIDEKGVRYAIFKYAYGKAISTEHIGGVNKYSIDHSYARVTDPNMAVRDYDFQDVLGLKRLTWQSQPGGSGCASASSAISYDPLNGNVASTTDFNQKRTCFAYDTRSREVARVEGLESSASCNSTAQNAALPTGSRKTSKQWHPDWRLETKVAEPGRITTSVYNGQPDPLNGNAIASCAPTTALLPDGKRIAVLCKRVEQATIDVNGAAGFSATLQAGVVARTWQWTYNEYGQVLTEDGPRTDVTDVTTYAYYTDTTADHTKGDLRQVTNAVGKVTQYTKYNKHGQVLESVDPNAVLTVNTYDLRQRLLSTAVGGQTTGYASDQEGQLKRVTLPDTTYVGYDYDDVHRLVAVYDHLGNRTTYELDNAGNRTSQKTTDPTNQLKRQLDRSIDALGRVQQTTGRE